MTGRLSPVEKVTDFDPAEAIGVSRTPVREALLLLESQGFVKTKITIMR
ncbi:GntR family transcriptional regulator [Bacillus swezeyi]|nr:GntR family transcriptional regulator [Bacillus swezeyi]